MLFLIYSTSTADQVHAQGGESPKQLGSNSESLAPEHTSPPSSCFPLTQLLIYVEDSRTPGSEILETLIPIKITGVIGIATYKTTKEMQTANKYLTSLVIKDMQIKTIGQHFSPSKLSKKN